MTAAVRDDSAAPLAPRPPQGRAWVPRLLPAGRPVRGSDRAELALLLAVLLLCVATPARDAGGGFNAPFKAELEAATGGGLCLFRRLTEIPCGGCGLTRAFVQLGHGEVAAAIALNPIAPLLFAWFLGKLAESAALNLTGRRLCLGIPPPWRWRFYLAVGVGVLALGALRLAVGLLGYPAAV